MKKSNNIGKGIKLSKWWSTMVNILEGQFPKGKSKERGRALVMLAHTEMMLEGFKFNEDGAPIVKEKST